MSKLSEAAALMGRKGGLKGGLARGKRKSRGNAAYYRALQAKAMAARKPKASKGER